MRSDRGPTEIRGPGKDASSQISDAFTSGAAGAAGPALALGHHRRDPIVQLTEQRDEAGGVALGAARDLLVLRRASRRRRALPLEEVVQITGGVDSVQTRRPRPSAGGRRGRPYVGKARPAGDTADAVDEDARSSAAHARRRRSTTVAS